MFRKRAWDYKVSVSICTAINVLLVLRMRINIYIKPKTMMGFHYKTMSSVSKISLAF